jgi:hypothetical protein
MGKKHASTFPSTFFLRLPQIPHFVRDDKVRVFTVPETPKEGRQVYSFFVIVRERC